MISVSLWQVVIFVLAGVAVGAIVTILTMARGSRSDKPEPVATQRAFPPTDTVMATTKSVAKQVPEEDAEQTHQVRVERVTAILKDCIAKKRNLTVGETARILDVSPRRVRRLLDSGTLIPVPTTDGGRLVSAVSVLDLVVHSPGERTPPNRAKEKEQVKPEVRTDTFEGAGSVPRVGDELSPGPNQLYWYHVEGHDKPLRSIREALRVMGLDYAYTDWNAIPKNVRDKMRRERVQRNVSG